MSNGNELLKKEDFIILVVDDEPDIVKKTVSLLKVEDYNAIGVQGGPEAIDVVKNRQVDVMILDYFMPVMTGEEVVREIRKFNKEVIILLHTGYAGEKPPLQMLEVLNIQGYLDKTEGPDKLFLWAAACVRMCALMRENKSMFEEVALAHQTIKSIKENQARLIEQTRLASAGYLSKGVVQNLKNSLMSLAGCTKAMEELIGEYDESVDSQEVTKEDHHEIAGEMKKMVKDMIPSLSKINNSLDALLTQAIKNDRPVEDSFTLEELVKKVDIIMKNELKIYLCKQNIDLQADRYTMLKGSITNLIYVFDNLILNAIRSYEGNGGQIDFNIVKKDNCVEFSIKHYGKGLSKDMQDKLSSGKPDSDFGDETGLGLYVSRTIIKEDFGGQMRIESEEDKGTSFFVSIPV